MSGFDLLDGVRVIELAQLAPAGLGGHLADLGASVIHVEPLAGDPTRHAGGDVVGPDGVGMLHLRWNRGKRSLAIDLRTPAGREIVGSLVASADAFVDGFRAGAVDRMGLDAATCQERNPGLVYVSVSGYGADGPYRRLGSHGPAFDSFAGLLPPVPDAEGDPHIGDWTPVGMHAVGLYAAMSVCAALVKARTTGRGSVLEIAAADVSATWMPDRIDVELNRDLTRKNGTYLPDGRLTLWPRLTYYAAKDGRVLFFQPYEDRFWEAFCAAVDRPDLLAHPLDIGGDTATADDLWRRLRDLFRTRTYDEWMELFAAHGVPTGPINSMESLPRDPHFRARRSTYTTELEGIGELTLTASPLRVADQRFAPAAAPRCGQDTAEVLGSLGLSVDEITSLAREGVIGLDHATRETG